MGNDNWYAVGAITEIQSYNVNIKNNCTKIWGLTGEFFPRTIEIGRFDVTGSFAKDFIGAEEIAEIEGERHGRIIFTIATGETIQVENIAYDSLDTDNEPNELSEQDIAWTGDSYTFP